MSNENWQKGYKEVKNVIHNEIGLTKEEIKDVFREVAKEEIKQLVEANHPFIFSTMKEVIQAEMQSAVSEHRYPKVNGNMIFYGKNGQGENSFKDYVSGVMKEEIVRKLEDQFSVDINISER